MGLGAELIGVDWHLGGVDRSWLGFWGREEAKTQRSAKKRALMPMCAALASALYAAALNCATLHMHKTALHYDALACALPRATPRCAPLAARSTGALPRPAVHMVPLDVFRVLI